MKTLSAKVAFVTGAGRGVGRSIALSLAQHGVKIAAQDNSPVNLDETLDMIRTAGGQVLELIGDMSKKMQVQSMIEQGRAALGEIDLLINQGSVAPEADLLTMDEWDWDRTLGVNIKGYFLAIQSLGRLMSARGQGTIINVVIPPTRYLPMKRYPAYEVSAAGVRELTRQAGEELEPQGVRVCGVQPAVDEWRTDSLAEEAVDRTRTWWQQNPDRFTAALVQLCAAPDQIQQGCVFTVKQDGSLQKP